MWTVPRSIPSAGPDLHHRYSLKVKGARCDYFRAHAIEDMTFYGNVSCIQPCTRELAYRLLDSIAADVTDRVTESDRSCTLVACGASICEPGIQTAYSHTTE